MFDERLMKGLGARVMMLPDKHSSIPNHSQGRSQGSQGRSNSQTAARAMAVKTKRKNFEQRLKMLSSFPYRIN